MANDLVVQLGAKLDQFAADMNQAGDMADSAVSRIEQSFANLNPGVGLGGLTGIFTGATASIGALLAALHGVNSELADISKNAEFVGVTVQRFQQLQFAAGQGGVDSGQAATDLRNVASLLADAKVNENSLTKLLEANNIAYKDRNGTIITTNQLLAIAGDLLNRFTSMPEKTKAAQQLGLSEQWVDALKNGNKAFEDIAAGAQAAGAVIDSQTVAKAANFDQAWKQSTAALAAQFKAVGGDIAGYLDGLIDKANQFITSLAASSGAPGSGQAKFNAIADALDVARKDALGLEQDFEQVNQVLEHYKTLISADPAIIAGLEAVRDKAKEIADEAQRAAQAVSASNFPTGVPSPASRPSSANDPAADAATLASRQKDVNDVVDRAINTLQRHTEQQKADAQAVGLGDAALAGFRAEAAETAAVLANGGIETDKQVDKFSDLKDAAIAAADALAKAKVASNIDFGSKTVLLSQEDVQIANQLKGIYGNDVQAALNSDAAAALRLQNGIKGVSSSIENDLVGGLTDITTGTKTVSAGFASMATSVISDIEKMIIKIAIVQPLMQALQASANSLGIFGFSGAVNANGSIAGALGPTSVGGAPLVAAAGGFISGPGSNTSDSIPARLSNGEYVVNADAVSKHRGLLEAINKGSIGLAGGGLVGMPSIPDVSPRSGSGSITVINQTGVQANPAVNRGPNGDTTIVLKKMVDGMVGDSIANGSGRRALASGFGIKPFMGS